MHSSQPTPPPRRSFKSSGIYVEFTNGETDPQLAMMLTLILQAVVRGEGKKLKHLCIVLADDEMLRDLNRRYGGVNEPTDVLAFDLSDEEGVVEGDIYISVLRAALQAAEKGEKTETELLRLAVHGGLHLCGWDHCDEVSLERMMRRGEEFIHQLKGRTGGC